MNKDVTIVIPARYGSTRFEGKPLKKIGSKTMLAHACDTALSAASSMTNSRVIVATDDQRIIDHAKNIEGVQTVMTPTSCATGSDRVLAAIDAINLKTDIVISLQGDAPFTPPHFLSQIAQALIAKPDCQVATPVVALDWNELDTLREHKKVTPFSGTTVVLNQQQRALWFSKNILPAIRKEEELRKSSPFSPVYQHIGLYGFQVSALRKFVTLSEGYYEKLEGLEQLRLLENDMHIHAEIVRYDELGPMPGIDTPEDLARTEKLLQKAGRLI